MKKIIRNLHFWFEYHIGYHLTNGKKLDAWSKNILSKFPEKFKKQ